ncbi:MAG TPA: hypothetical protein VLF15_11705 [Pseudoxanthomonas sp.]|nr:hypothetical protein [Pseudoxanthomonas sp.]
MFNDSGSLQIDETYSNLFLHQRAVIATATAISFGISVVDFTIPNCRYWPTIFANCELPSKCSVQSMSGTTANCRALVVGAVGTPLTYYAFDRAPNVAVANYGLQVFDAAGNITFDALRSPMRIVDSHVALGNSGSSKQYAAGRTYAVAVTGGAWLFPVGGSGGQPAGYAVQKLFGRVNGATVNIGPNQVSSGLGGSFSQVRSGWANVADVTNY